MMWSRVANHLLLGHLYSIFIPRSRVLLILLLLLLPPLIDVQEMSVLFLSLLYCCISASTQTCPLLSTLTAFPLYTVIFFFLLPLPFPLLSFLFLSLRSDWSHHQHNSSSSEQLRSSPPAQLPHRTPHLCVECRMCELCGPWTF